MQSKGKDWGVYASLPDAISALQRTYTTSPGHPPPYTTSPAHLSPTATHPRKLTFRVYFSSSDVMIGKGGQQYFENCWEQGNVQGDIEFVAKTVPDTDHDSIILPEKGWIEENFAEVRRVMS